MSNERLVIEAEPRETVGKNVKKLRREGIIPAVIYGQGDPVNVQLDNRILRRVLRVAGTTQLIDVQIGNSKKTVLTREIQQHVTRGDLIHVDFLEVDMKGTVTSEATLVAVGVPQLQRDAVGSGILSLQSVAIEANPNDLVSEIEVDMTQLVDVDTVLFVRDLPVPEGITILAEPDTVVARFEITRTEAEEEAAADMEAGEVEVYSAAGDDEGDEAEDSL